MDALLPLADVLRNLGFVLYGGPIFAFAILVSAAQRIPRIEPWEIVRTYRSYGAGLGLSMGATVLGLLFGYWVRHGSFSWGWSTPDEQLVLAGFLAFLVLWASNLVLEVWTLDPLRKLDGDDGVSDPAAYLAATARLGRHLMLQAGLVVLVTVLATLAAG